MEKNVELLQVSCLEDYDWPETDPHLVPQRTRAMIDNDIELVRQCLNSAKIDKDAFTKNVRKENLSLAEIVLRILSHEKFQMNPVKEVRNEQRWKDSVEKAISNNKPIDIVYPQFCVIPNAPKRYTNIGSAAGEDCTIELFKLINTHVKWFYDPGVHFHALADASLYASAFGTHQIEVAEYYECIKKRITELKATDCVFLYDYSELLRQCQPDYLLQYYSINQKSWAGKVDELLPNTDIPTLRRSIRCSINTRRFQLNHQDHLQLFGPMKWRNENHPFFKPIELMTEIAFHEAVTIRLACGAIDISSRLWPDAIRATCHKGQKNGRWAIGLRTYPEYYGSCKLLPYHGMPVITKSGKGKPKLEIEPEVLLRCRKDLIRVTIGAGDEVYFYVAEEIEKEMLDKIDYSKPIGMRKNEFK